MTLLELQTLIQDDIQNIIHKNIENDPAKVALTVKEHGALIATQVKYLQRARTKLPSYYHAKCIIPSLAFEQCSSEQTAATKQHSGELCIDLTCGLGVDSFYLAQGFKSVISIEQDELLTEVARHNFRLLGADNIKIVNTSAEDFIAKLITGGDFAAEVNGQINKATYERDKVVEAKKSEVAGGLPIDLIYVDPARRGTKGNKLFLLEECSPNVIELMPKLLQLSNRIVIKASPLFDIDEAIKIFSSPDVSITVETVSLDGECKELLIELTRRSGKHNDLSNNIISDPLIKVTIAGRGSLLFCNGVIISSSDYTVSNEANSVDSISNTTEDNYGGSVGSSNDTAGGSKGDCSSQQITKLPFSPPYSHLMIPDVTLYKARLTIAYMSAQGAYTTSSTGYGLTNVPIPNFWGQQHAIEEIIPYHPKKFKALLKQKGITRAIILKKDFPHDADAIAKALDIKLGGITKIAFTKINNSPYAIILKND